MPIINTYFGFHFKINENGLHTLTHLKKKSECHRIFSKSSFLNTIRQTQYQASFADECLMVLAHDYASNARLSQ